MSNKDKAQFKRAFKELYKGKRLLALHLDGFTHSVIYDDGTADSCIQQDSFSHYTSGWNEKATLLLGQFPNFAYQNNPVEVVWVNPEDR